ncbi:Inosine-uridine preferring nucleoside hydrolase [Novosphingobium sp. Rr 2-17]|uniref:nucleoside hydrolase n=1 Tax=Novosphingobium sp. Rr 2-17 TaxID=555793 RepID=UPI0002698EEC|nr:nucleoside hydrolase [Novosphingobium sp. Rr 2-17]EIZ78661.1 Inosine-uridine preferring nucleoside hydrolase [Novosphingobium sp. Rr 2-17]
MICNAAKASLSRSGKRGQRTVVRLTAMLCAAAFVAPFPAAAETAPSPALTKKTSGQPQTDLRRKVIIDDDGFALMQLMLLGAPDVDVIGITSVTGGSWANRVTAQALKGLERAGRTDVPVAVGATYPLVNSEALTDKWEALYGKLTWKGAWMRQWVEPTKQSTPAYHGPEDAVDLPGGNPTTHPVQESAARFLIDMVHKYPGEVTIVAAGPMTNLALAQRLDPQFASLAKELVYMGGSFNPHQVIDNRSAEEFAREFANSPRREFNIRFDPEAASIVSRSPWRRITVIPVDPSTATQLTPSLRERLAQGAGPEVGASIRAQEEGFPLWDEIAAGVWLDPKIVTKHEQLYVDFDTQFGPSYGDTLSWREHYQPGVGEQKADVILAIDPQRLYALIAQTVATFGKPPAKP